MLASLAGAAFHSGGLLKGASTGQRSLVFIRLASDSGLAAIGPDASGHSLPVTIAGSGQQIALHPALVDVQGLFARGFLALVDETAAGGPLRGYAPNGFGAPQWLLQAAGVSVTSAQHAYGFSSGLLMLTTGPAIAGSHLDNPSLLTQANRSNFVFPNSSIGRQLRQVAGLLSASGGPRHFVVSLGASLTVGGAADQASERLRQLDAALPAFAEATYAIGLAAGVTTVTDPDVCSGAGHRLLMVAGGRVLGGQLYSLGSSDVDGQLAPWAGLGSALPSASIARFLY